jgi:predicted deacylase
MVARGGAGPTILLTGANHGDEYEGSVALMRLMREISPDRLNGRLIIIPGLNFPAFLNGTRTSPIDKGNLNRVFPGKRNGTPTEMIAHYIESELMPRADCALDFHAGGSTMNYLPMLFVVTPTDEIAREKTERMIEAFAAPRVLNMGALESDQMIGSAARRHGAFFMTGEFGGGGTVSLDGLAIVERGIRGVLKALGVMVGPPLSAPPSSIKRYTFRPEHYVFAPIPGIFEPACRLGDEVRVGQLAGLIYDPYRPWLPPEQVAFNAEGLTVMQRTYARVDAGDCLAHLCEEQPSSQSL